jgi:hypothetical protein
MHWCQVCLIKFYLYDVKIFLLSRCFFQFLKDGRASSTHVGIYVCAKSVKNIRNFQVAMHVCLVFFTKIAKIVFLQNSFFVR